MATKNRNFCKGHLKYEPVFFDDDNRAKDKEKI